MYSVSNTYLEKMNDLRTEHRLTGTIGSDQFTAENIVEGSFIITRQSTDTSDVVLGSCYVGELQAEFTGIPIGWANWVGKVITPSFGLKIGPGVNDWENVPLGVFKVAKATHTSAGVKVTAYDNMTKFDKKFKKSHFMGVAGMYNIISRICTDCGVTLGMSSAQIQALPNGTRTGINIYGSSGLKKDFANDIDTYRDLLFWCAQTLGCFATIDRAGQLVFRQYTQTVVERITDENRISGATFEDYITHYIGIYVENLDSNTEDYYGYDSTAIQAEITETGTEIAADNVRIEELVADLEEWDRKLENHECTQEEYDAAVAEITAELHPLEIEVKQLNKRLAWLQKALEQSGDGADMVLGANPLVMAKNLTTRDAQRREILGALAGISYTPFSASVICGAHYDLGDVIQFAGGLYNSSTDTFGCVMEWVYTHNQGTELQGFGVDPAIVKVRNKNQKSTDRSERNAIDTSKASDYTLQKIDDPTTPTPPAGMENSKVGLVTNKPGDDGKRTMEYWTWNSLAWTTPGWAIWRGLTLQAQIPFVVVTTPETVGQNPRSVEVDGTVRQAKAIYLIGRWEGYAGDVLSQLPLEQEWQFMKGSQSESESQVIKPQFNARFNNMYNIGVTSKEYFYCGIFQGSTAVGLIDEGVEADYKFNNMAEIVAAINAGNIRVDETANTPSDNVKTLPSEKNAKKVSEALAGLGNTLSSNTSSGTRGAVSSSSDADEPFITGADIMSDENLEEIAEAVTNINTSMQSNVKDVRGYYDGRSLTLIKQLFSGRSGHVLDVPGLETTGKLPTDIGRDVNNNSLLFVMGDASGLELTKKADHDWTATAPDFSAMDFGYFSNMTGKRNNAVSEHPYCTFKLEGMGAGVTHAMQLTEYVTPYRHRQTFLMWAFKTGYGNGFEVVRVTVYCSSQWVLAAFPKSDTTYTFTYDGVTYNKHWLDLCFEVDKHDQDITMYQTVLWSENDPFDIELKDDPTHAGGTYWYFETDTIGGLLDESFINYLYEDQDALNADVRNVTYDHNFTPGLPLGVLFSTSDTVSDFSTLPTDRGTWNSSKLFHSFYADGEEHTLTCNFTSPADVMYMHFIFDGLAPAAEMLLTTIHVGVKGINDSLMEYGIKRLYGKWGDRWYRYLDDEAGTKDYPALTNKPQINSVTLLGNKTTRDLGMIQELTQAEYDNLTTEQKNNPDKVYYIKDAGGGGGGGSSTFAGLSDVEISNPTNGQVPKYNATTQKWENANESGGGGYTETELFSGSHTTNAELTLSDDIGNYKDIILWCGWSAANVNGLVPIRFSVSMFKTFTYASSPSTATEHVFCYLYNTQYFRVARGSTDTKLFMFDNHSGAIKKVIGIKY